MCVCVCVCEVRAIGRTRVTEIMYNKNPMEEEVPSLYTKYSRTL